MYTIINKYNLIININFLKVGRVFDLFYIIKVSIDFLIFQYTSVVLNNLINNIVLK